MVTRTRRGWPAAVWAALAILGLPALAEAQLLPHVGIRRQRPPCEAEPPIYKVTRQQYFGYYPTCWRKFPTGWGCPCPNPEKPGPWKPEKPREPNDPLLPVGEAGSPENDPRNPAGGNDIPPLSNDRSSPFDIDPKSPAPAPSLPEDTKPRPRDPGGVNPAPNREEPPVTPPLSDGRSMKVDDPFGPMPATPPSSLPIAETSPILDPGQPSAPIAAPLAPEVLPAPAQAPQRRSMLSSLLNRKRR